MMASISPQVSEAQGFTGAEFSAWSQTSQDSYIQSSVMMAGVIGAQVQPEISTCIDTWYFANEATKTEQNAFIRQTIASYENFHPSGVILAIVQQKCGAFD